MSEPRVEVEGPLVFVDGVAVAFVRRTAEQREQDECDEAYGRVSETTGAASWTLMERANRKEPK